VYDDVDLSISARTTRVELAV